MDAGVSNSYDNDVSCPESMPIKKKRKQRGTPTTETEQGCSKFGRFDQPSGDNEEGFPWKNLQLILILQDKNTNLAKKVDLAFDYVKSSSVKEMDDISWCSRVMETSRTVIFLSNWVQSVLISSEKKMRLEENKLEFETPGSCLDIRCWQILGFCLEESKKLCMSLTCSKDFLWVIHSITMNVLSCLNNHSFFEGTFSGEQLRLYDVVLDCLSLIFSSHAGVANENLESWILLIDKVLELILKVVRVDGSSNLVNFIFRFSCYLFNPFAQFLRVHPVRKNGFANFIDKLLQPLLYTLHALHSTSCDSEVEWRTNLSNFIKEVLAQGLFHSVHIDGFLTLQSTNRYRNSSDSTVKEEKLVNKSYHRHLFDKVEKIVSQKNELSLLCLGDLLQSFVSCVAKSKRTSVSGVSMLLDVKSVSHGPTYPSHSTTATSESMDGELRKSIIDFCVHILEYLLVDLNKYLLFDEEVVSMLFNVSITVQSINNMLSSFICEKIYVRAEDISDGAFRNFLRIIYAKVMSLSAKTAPQKTSLFVLGDESHRELLASVRKELIFSVQRLLDIEYDVVGDNVESLWTLAFSSVPYCYGSVDVMNQSSLFAEILSLGCKLIDIYSELRQVDTSIFALLRAARHSLPSVGDNGACTTSHTCLPYSNSLSMLLCSLQFRLSLGKAIRAIPERQVSGCIQQLSSDISDSILWMKFGHQLDDLDGNVNLSPRSCESLQLHLRAELLGKVLCEVYAVILDSVRVTSGNSYLVCDSLKKLMDITHPSLSGLASLHPDGGNKFFIAVHGVALDNTTGCDDLSMCWILVVIFRLLLSGRSLFHKAIILMDPDAQKKMSEVVGDSFIIHTGRDCLAMADLNCKSFLSCSLHPSEDLLNVIRNASNVCTQDSVVLCAPLMYILIVMALQRLDDLNSLIESSAYMHKWNRPKSWNGLMGYAGSSLFNKIIRRWKRYERCSKWRKRALAARNEAKGLMQFIMGNILSIEKGHVIKPLLDDVIYDTLIQGQHSIDAFNCAIGSLDETSLPFALWCIMCQNVDIWCSHAAKKDLTCFVSLIIQTSHSGSNDNDSDLKMHYTVKPGHRDILHQITMKFLHNDAVCEDKFVCWYMAPWFCKILWKCVSSLFATSRENLSSPDWVEVISTVENLSDLRQWITHRMVPLKSSDKQNVEFSTCQNLLNLLMQMPKEFKSSSLYITHVLNLERLLVGSLLGWHSTLSLNPYQIFQLFATCRRGLLILTAASSEEKVNGSQYPLTCKLPECSFPLVWLLKSLSVVIAFQCTFPEQIDHETKFEIFSLLDHTSNLLQMVSRDKYKFRINYLVSTGNLHGERKGLIPCIEESDKSQYGLQVNPEKYLASSQSVMEVAVALEHIQKSLAYIKETCLGKKAELMTTFRDLNKISMVIACLNGLLLGLASTLGDMSTSSSDFRIKFPSYDADLMTQISSCENNFGTSITFVLKSMFLEDDPTLCDASGAKELSCQHVGSSDISNERHAQGNLVSSNIKEYKKGSVYKEPCPAIPDLEAFLAEVQQQEFSLKKSGLLEVLSGENAEVTIFLRQVFISCSAILRLNLQVNFAFSSWSMLPVLVAISEFLLLEFTRIEMPHQFAFSCLEVAVKFLEQLGNYFPQFDPSMSRDLYTKLIGLHLRVIGKCISLQGKNAKLALKDAASPAKNLIDQVQSDFHSGSSRLNGLIERLRMSFKTYIKKSSELHLLSAIQAVERALVGVQEGFTSNYDVVCESSDGGEVSSISAAGIDALDLILEHIAGPKRLNMIKRHIQSLVGCLHNVILHLQGPRVFYRCVDAIKAYAKPDSGSAIHMCIDVLTKILGKSSLFKIDACHVAVSLRLPGALFQYFLQLQIPEAHAKTASTIGTSNIPIDRTFSVELYASCCHLLRTTIKNHKSETRHCMAILEDSIAVLLHCLESGNGRELKFAWEVEEAVICADCLQRVYEEVRLQKDLLGQCAFLLLSCYIWVYSGFGPAGNGIIREVDEAMRPGLYALIDSCSADDLQLLHTQFGEGPCRTTLAALQHDYKIKFRFEGKV